MRTFTNFALSIALVATVVCARAADRQIYPAPEQAKTDIAAAIHKAQAEHKRVLLDFGGDWCPDCQVLDIYFHDSMNKPLLDANYVLVHVNVGHFDANLDLTEKYEVPIHKGVPALAVLAENGDLLYSQQGGEFESMSKMQSSAVTKFLVEWRPQDAGCSVTTVNC